MVLAGVGLACAAVALGSFAMAYFGTHPRRRGLRQTPRDEGLRYDEVEFQSRDGIRLSGWFIPCPGARSCIVLCHGFPNNRSEMLPWVRMLRETDAHLLLFDFRAMGLSDGATCSIGYEEVNDLLGAVDYLGSRADVEGLPIGVFGLSMGGAVAIMSAARDDRIAAVASHGAYATLDRAIKQRSRLFLGPFHGALHGPVKWWGRRWSTIDPALVSPLDVIGSISPRPVLLMHGGRDRITNPADSRDLYEAAGEPKAFHRMRRSWHVRIHRSEQVRYERELVRFFRARL
jgi:alpha-beta hydrolase superfamily lysophospholipase